ncbi:MAG: hypothetical protein HUU55_04810 [Myxococcales bacterium]|nr:hypothetical protein [Myxococcales bacterium]
MLPPNSKFVHVGWSVVALTAGAVLLFSLWQGGDWAAAGRAVANATRRGDTVVVTPGHYYREIGFFGDRIAIASNIFPQQLFGRSSRLCIVSHGMPPDEWRNNLRSKRVILDEEFGSVSALCVVNVEEAVHE